MMRRKILDETPVTIRVTVPTWVRNMLRGRAKFLNAENPDEEPMTGNDVAAAWLESAAGQGPDVQP